MRPFLISTHSNSPLKALILSQHEQFLSNDEQLALRDSEIEQLKLLIAKLRRMQFGRKSEKLESQIEQLELKLDELKASRAERGLLPHFPKPGLAAKHGCSAAKE
jgi:transposase